FLATLPCRADACAQRSDGTVLCATPGRDAGARWVLPAALPVTDGGLDAPAWAPGSRVIARDAREAWLDDGAAAPATSDRVRELAARAGEARDIAFAFSADTRYTWAADVVSTVLAIVPGSPRASVLAEGRGRSVGSLPLGLPRLEPSGDTEVPSSRTVTVTVLDNATRVLRDGMTREVPAGKAAAAAIDRALATVCPKSSGPADLVLLRVSPSVRWGKAIRIAASARHACGGGGGATPVVLAIAPPQ
ncbi:MAG: hypothetical protein FJ087_22190, partial [Deltaproteobacteria bacterium]|nr:hypothetical protein [Deltaproteobacteria bacterium]